MAHNGVGALLVVAHCLFLLADVGAEAVDSAAQPGEGALAVERRSCGFCEGFVASTAA